MSSAKIAVTDERQTGWQIGFNSGRCFNSWLQHCTSWIVEWIQVRPNGISMNRKLLLWTLREANWRWWTEMKTETWGTAVVGWKMNRKTIIIWSNKMQPHFSFRFRKCIKQKKCTLFALLLLGLYNVNLFFDMPWSGFHNTTAIRFFTSRWQSFWYRQIKQLSIFQHAGDT